MPKSKIISIRHRQTDGTKLTKESHLRYKVFFWCVSEPNLDCDAHDYTLKLFDFTTLS